MQKKTFVAGYCEPEHFIPFPELDTEQTEDDTNEDKDEENDDDIHEL